MSDTILTELKDGIFTITMNRPKVNALNLDMVNSLRGAFKVAGQEEQACVVLFRGEGEVFSAGQDVYEILQAEGESYRKHLLESYNPLVLQIRMMDKPVLAEIRGTAAGAALGLALACDLRIASEDARFVVGFPGIGLALDSGVSLFLPALIGFGRAAEVVFTNEPISAQQALNWGLVNRVVPAHSLHASALQMAMVLKKGPLYAMGLAKRDLNKANYPHLEEVLDYEAHIQEIARRGAEHKEGVKAFVEKRNPDWKTC